MSDQTPTPTPESVRRYDDRDMAEAYLAGYMAAEAVWTDGTERSVDRIEHIAEEFGAWLEDYDIEESGGVS